MQNIFIMECVLWLLYHERMVLKNGLHDVILFRKHPHSMNQVGKWLKLLFET